MEEIKRLVEDRQNMATKKQLSPKMMTIVVNLGSGIYGDCGFGGGINSSTLNTNEWMLPEETGEDLVATADDVDYSDIGYIFDSLNIGHNFEICYFKNERKLRAKYNGYIVYLEEEGKLKAYVPNSTWESLVDWFYVKAKPIEDKAREKTKNENQKSFMKQTANFMKELRESWGI